MRFGFSVIGLVIFLVPMLINIVYFLLPPVDEKKDGESRKQKEERKENRILSMIESGSRIAYAIAICCLVSKAEISYRSPLLYVSIVFLILYYIVWIRYFIGGRKMRLLGSSFLFVPMPLAIFPVLYFLFAALWVHNYYAMGVMILFGIAHNVISYQELYHK